jgi:hypothetical protein
MPHVIHNLRKLTDFRIKSSCWWGGANLCWHLYFPLVQGRVYPTPKKPGARFWHLGISKAEQEKGPRDHRRTVSNSGEISLVRQRQPPLSVQRGQLRIIRTNTGL